MANEPTEAPAVVQTAESSVPPAAAADFFIVGIGASAGGLEALEQFFAHLPKEPCGLAFVVIQHLSPTHKSIMDALLQKQTTMPVREIQDGMVLTPNCVYLNPPNKQVLMFQRTLQLVDLKADHRVPLPIDQFFRSLADDQADRAIGIVLSGTGSDGTLGLKAIKGAGGLIMVQDPADAQYDGMPHSAIETGMADYVLPAAALPAALLKYARHPSLAKPAGVDANFQRGVQKVLGLIRFHTGHDFSNYKLTTIRRRLERRMIVQQIDRIDDYIRFLQSAPAEVNTLFEEMLIGVTNFFRDAAAFEFLAEQVLPDLITQKAPNEPLRVWVAGCATGEEAYSLAIVIAETLTRLKRVNPVQVFASDLDAHAINAARQGIYPAGIAADVSRERLQEFFFNVNNQYQVRKYLRDMVVFTVHNVVKDPPFSKLDLLSCRNVLIYMDSVLQKQLFPMFHYTLMPRGLLFLGTSESIGDFTDLFAPLNPKWKIFTRKETARIWVQEYASLPYFKRSSRLAAHAADAMRHAPSGINIQRVAEKIMLDSYAPPGVIINEHAEILYFIGDTAPFLKPPTGEPTFQLLRLVRESLRERLALALHEAMLKGEPCLTEGLVMMQHGHARTVDVTVKPIATVALLLVVFQERPVVNANGSSNVGLTAGDERDPRVASLEQELQATRESLQSAIEQLETSNEELKSTNEELQSVNEELQSTNEELEASKEELQSMNEELVTVNAELQHNLEDFARANDDINNILASIDIGTIFLDIELKIKRFTPAMAKIFHLIGSDVGRPLSDITSTLKYDRLVADAQTVLLTLQRQELELQDTAGHWYLSRLLPYQTAHRKIDGVVITFVDITAAAEAQLYAESIVATVHEPFLILNAELHVKSANQAFYQTFHIVPADAEGRLVYDLGNRQWDIPELRVLLEQIITVNEQFAAYRVAHDFPGLGQRTFLLNGRRVTQAAARPPLILLAFEDVTER